MKRALVAPADLAGAALDELKRWLGIASAAEDSALTALLHASLDMCEAFTGSVPLEAGCEEILPSRRDWQTLSARPVQAVTGIETVAPDGTRSAIASVDYEFDLLADGTAAVRLLRDAGEVRLAVRYVAGLAAQWPSLPDALRHGIIRLAAHHYRGRDSGDASGPPAAVAALWRPWRQVRLR